MNGVKVIEMTVTPAAVVPDPLVGVAMYPGTGATAYPNGVAAP